MNIENVKRLIQNECKPLAIRTILFCWAIPVMVVMLDTIQWRFYNVFNIPFPLILVLWGLYVFWGLIIITLIITDGGMLHFLTRELYISSCCGLICFAAIKLAISVLVSNGNMISLLPGVLLITVITFSCAKMGVYLTKRKIYHLSNEESWNKQWMIPARIGNKLPALGVVSGFIAAPLIFANISDEVLESPWIAFGMFMAIFVLFAIPGTIAYYYAYLIRKFKLSNIKVGQK